MYIVLAAFPINNLNLLWRSISEGHVRRAFHKICGIASKISDEAVENNIFNPNLHKSMFSFAPLREYFESLNLMLGIVEDLNLDRRILHKAAPN
ncbi:MAG: DUF3137 domain-containing protein [Nostoc sp.]|uniref:DUF3137 domain-containing protein n=1 Tax=Nostoc sp. TaxID=1180 RepID=UPI002FF908D8